MKFKARKYVAEKEYPFSKETAWQLLADNNRLNFYIGLFPVAFSGAVKEGAGIFYREAQAKVGGIVPMKWQEFPFQWEEHKNYSVERRYLTSPVKHCTWGIEFLDSDDGDADKTKIRITGNFMPRNVFGIPAIHFVAAKTVADSLTYTDDYLASGAKEIFQPPQKSQNHKVNVQELLRLEGLLRKYPVDEAFIGLLHRYLMERSDHDVAQIEPHKVAQEWNEDPDSVLRVLLYAAKAGLLNLSWNLICPNCRVSKVEFSSLSQLKPEFHCDLCGVNYDASFDQFVELHFSVHPSIRKAHAEVFCVGAPMITPHVKAQKVIKRGETVSIAAPPIEDRLRLRVLQANHMAEVVSSLEAAPIVYSDSGWSSASVSGQSEIQIHNDSSNDIVVALEQAAWNKKTVTAAKVTAMQEFRDLFSSEVLSPGQNVDIDHVTILFTDLVGSTSLYETVGDSNAYGQVRSHFDFLVERIATNSGSVVKTIGDAVMAVFHEPADGLKAALEIQKEISTFNKTVNEDFILRIGLYSGPAIAVNSNDRLDYFGRTVNIAARIQAQGTGGDIIFSEDYLQQENLRKLLEENHVELEAFQANLKGIEGSMNLVRVNCSRARHANNSRAIVAQ